MKHWLLSLSIGLAAFAAMGCGNNACVRKACFNEDGDVDPSGRCRFTCFDVALSDGDPCDCSDLKVACMYSEEDSCTDLGFSESPAINVPESEYDDSGLSYNLRPGEQFPSDSSSGSGSQSSGSPSGGGCGDYMGPTSDVQRDSFCQAAWSAGCAGLTSEKASHCETYNSSSWGSSGSCPYC